MGSVCEDGWFEPTSTHFPFLLASPPHIMWRVIFWIPKSGMLVWMKKKDSSMLVSGTFIPFYWFIALPDGITIGKTDFLPHLFVMLATHSMIIKSIKIITAIKFSILKDFTNWRPQTYGQLFFFFFNIIILQTHTLDNFSRTQDYTPTICCNISTVVILQTQDLTSTHVIKHHILHDTFYRRLCSGHSWTSWSFSAWFGGIFS